MIMKRALSLILALVMLIGLLPMQAFATEAQSADSSLEGLNVLCLGDSITAGQGLTTDTRWTNILASKYGWNLTNKSQGGISLSSYYYTANGQTDVSIAKKAEVLKTMTTKPDVIIVWGGHNDTSYRASPLGSWEDDTTDSFKGALKYIAELAEDYAPDATLFVLTPIWNSEKASALKVSENAEDNDWMFIDAIYEGAERYGWIPINMDLCGITPYKKSEVFLDGIHPNAVGTEMIVEFLSEELASCGANSKKETVILNQSSVSLEVGKKATAKAALTPRSGSSTPVFTWSSSNTDVVTVNSSGVITAVAHGNATITAAADNGVSATVKVSVAEGEHTYTATVTAPTCTGQGYTTYTCACGDSYVADYVDATGEHAYENGTCTGCGAEEPINAKSMAMRYDDHLDMTGKTVEILDAGVPASYQVGYGVEENKVLDAAVVSLKGSTLVATGIGTAMVKIDGEVHEITVTAAPISLLLLIGQSNMRGSEGNADQSIVCPDGMVYATFGDDRGDAEGIMNVNNATNFAASALTGEYSVVNVNGTTDNLSYYPINSLTEAGKGTFGPDSGFAYEWVKQTGEKVWVVNAAHGGSAISSWQPNATNFKEAVLLFSACQETLRKEIAAGHYTLSHMGYFWCQGCNDASMTAETYVQKYLAMHEGLMAQLDFDHDCNSATAEMAFEFAGIIPILYGVNSYRAGEYKDQNTYTYYQSFEQLTFNGPRVAQYWMCNNPELEEIWMVCNIGEDWVWMPDGTNGVSAYFRSHYPGGTVDYTTQAPQKDSWYTPTTPAAVHDSIHYNQIGYNEVGRESARNALIMLGEIEAPDVEATVELFSWDGYTPVNKISASLTGNSGTLVVPKVFPVWKSKEIAYTLTDGFTWSYYDVLASDEGLTGALTMGDQTVSIEGHNWSEWKTLYEASPAGPGREERVCSHCDKVETREIDGVWQIYQLADHLLELPEDVCCDTNLWAILPHEDVHFTSGLKWGYVSVPVPSVTIPMNAGDRVYATSFIAKGDNGGPHSGIRVTFFDAQGVAWSVDPTVAYKEWKAKGYIEAPEGTIAANIPMWYDSEDYELYILNRDHIYENGTCAGCGDHKGAVIIRQPESVEVELGKKFAITVKAEGEGLTYQWYVKEAGAKAFKVSVNKTASYAYTMQDYMHGRQVYCVITDANGNQVTTETAAITRPSQTLTIIDQPQDARVNVGEKFSISPKVEGEGLTYQWYVKEAGAKAWKVSSNKTSAYAYTTQNYMIGRQVYCVITDKYGNSVTTDMATIQLPARELMILTQPTDVYASLGEKFSIAPEVQGEGLTYQWYYKNAGGKSFAASSNKTSAYAYSMQSYMNGRSVYCVITDQYGNTVQTETVTIHVR